MNLGIKPNLGFTRNKIPIFFIGYIMYFTGLFMDDLAVSFGPISKLIKYVSYLLFVLSVFEVKKSGKILFRATVCLGVSMVIALATRDIYFCILTLILFAANNYDSELMFMMSFYILLILTTITVFLSLVGIFPNLNTGNRNYSLRLAFGFYHSNVLPMVVYYLLAYRMMIKGNSIKNKELFVWCILCLGVFYFCRGRNGFVGSFFLVCGYLIYRNRMEFPILSFFSKFSTIIISTVLLILTSLQGRHYRSMYLINRFFTGRLALAYLQINKTGLHFISTINKNVYAQGQNFVLDSGYLYTAIRYGVAFLLFYGVIQYISASKYKNNTIALLVILINTVTNTIDNDLFAYNMLPFIIIASSRIDYNTTIRNVLDNIKLLKRKGFRWIDR